MIREATMKLAGREDLDYTEANACIDEIMSGETSPVQTAAFLTALSMKGETIEEITGCADAMRAHATPVQTDLDVLEIVGTGGDRSNSFNISTTSAIIAAAAGVPVSKHGNRAASSKCGTADCLEALGVNIELDPEKCEQLLKNIGICFLFAQKYHTSMKYVGPVRKELGFHTVFNILGPLTNPSSPKYQLLGVYSPDLVEPMAQALQKIGVKRGLVVHGRDVLDEISLSAPTLVCEFNENHRETYEIRPEDFGLKSCDKSALVGGDPAENAEICRSILQGETGPRRDVVLLNAGAALYAAEKVGSIAEGIELAAKVIDSGKAMEKLEAFIKESNR